MSRDALVVGINTYSYERLSNLTAPAQDAEAVAKLLESYGEFNVKRLPAVKNKENNTIKVGQKTGVTLAHLEDAIVQLFKPEGRNIPDTTLLYFSGHGLRKSRGGIHQGYLATSDVNPDLGNWGLSLQWLRQLLQSSEVKQQIIWLDCCYSGELLNFAEADPGDRGKGRDRCFIAASREFEPAFEAIDTNHSVLTTALLQALEPKEKQVTNYTVVDAISQNLPKFPQRPIFANSGGIIHLTRTQEPIKEVAENGVTSLVCPYRGLRYFDFIQEDAKYFHGRQSLTDQLLEKVRVSNFLAVLGASGSGKSSVVRAGLLYQLQQGKRLSGSDTWQIKIFQPGEHPLQSLARAFVSVGLSGGLSDIERASQLQQAEALIAGGGFSQLITVFYTPRVVLLVDQFEEVFTLCSDGNERQQFFDYLLAGLQRCGDKLCLVLTMRADFFGKCAEHGELAAKIQDNLLTVTPMSQSELRQAITAPAKQVNLALESELVEQIISDVADSPGFLPLLQYTLTELWGQRTEDKLTLAAYTRLGGVKGTLQKRATEVYEDLSGEEQEAAKRIFLELTQLGEGTEDTRRRVLLRDLVTSSHVEQVMQKLADARLIVTQEEFVDVAHEALIRHWLLLRKWLDENRDRLREKRKIEAAAQEWSNQGRKKDYLLPGGQLKKVKAWQKGEGKQLGLSQLAEEFIKASEKYRQRALLLTAGWVTIPIFVAFLVIIPHLRQQSFNEAWNTIRNKKLGSRAAMELLTEGCWEKRQWQWIPENILFLFFGGCSSFYREDLSKLNLYGANLNGANLNDADLNDADLNDADLRRANLYDAYLNGVNLKDANLGYANLNGANLGYANLGYANLNGVNLGYAKLYGADLSNANLSFANLNGAKLYGADLSNADLSLAKLSNTDLSSANLSSANLISADLSNAKLLIPNLEKAIYNKDTKLPQNFDPSKEQMILIAPGINLSGADLSSINFWNADFQGVNLTNANLEGSDLRYVQNLTPEQVKAAKNWEDAYYSNEFRKKLGLK
ncbi:pentapeptide repeat-containing protein [Calothrix sp. UHCC 0171]|uniref:nSTAND1 domain-containing NTPase n=1 Tax=Calothrix sp. UHCC 0171 TaxID=3110245 RepID=UPI002B213D58|nr:pentapeptide repeat-containing protein [Calothrix sp. UHCC 0171]MEA5570681.1 pentapeptide repeat-containing protein [Calothrix sp. UHCC 0171]